MSAVFRNARGEASALSGLRAPLSGIRCRLLYGSNGAHLQQLFTGFLMLHRNGNIRLTQAPRRTQVNYESDAPHLRDAGHAHLDVLLDGRTRIHFDTHDARELALGELNECDVYFKRSWSQEIVNGLPATQRYKVRPLGLNYRVLPDTVDPFAIRRSMLAGLSRPALGSIKQALDGRNRLGFQPRLSQMSAPPDMTATPRVLFLVAGYDPFDDPDRSREKIEERIEINESRARCVRLLRQSLGERFTGGFIPCPFTLEHYPELVMPAELTAQERYLKTLGVFPICIATTGLHGSIGWKFAEYVAFSKAILSEPLGFGLPGPFAAGRNYLEFTDAQECLRGALELLERPALRHELMRNNAQYYRSYLRPDVLVANALRESMAVRRN